jgi:hypothetical protein
MRLLVCLRQISEEISQSFASGSSRHPSASGSGARGREDYPSRCSRTYATSGTETSTFTLRFSLGMTSTST